MCRKEHIGNKEYYLRKLISSYILPTMSMTKRQSLDKGDDRLNSALTVTKVGYAGNKTKRSRYRTKSRTSEVDETLFGSPVRYNQQKETKRTSDRTWDPPWSEKNNNKTTGGYLMWSPTRPDSSNSSGRTMNTPRSVCSPRPININNSPSRRTPVQSNQNSARSNYSPSPRPPVSARSQKYRLRKHTDTFIDESLFGTNTDASKNLSYKDRYETKEKVPFMANSAWSSPVKH